MNRRTFLALLCILLIAATGFSAFACAKPEEPGGATPENDDGYALEIAGIGVESIFVTKAQIKQLGQTKSVAYTWQNPCFASDKTDDDENPIPHALKGVYLDDLLTEYADGSVSGYFSAMELYGDDGYYSLITADTFSEEHGGSKMIIAYEYDDIVLTPKERSGALRAVFPNQVANSWAKKLKKIVFTDANLSPPSPSVLGFLELLDENLYGSFEKEVTTGAGTELYTYYGISLEMLLSGGILNAGANDKMYLRAWDFMSDGTNSYSREYTNWKSNAFYANAFLVYSYEAADGEKQAYPRSPMFDGANILKGMSVKSVLSLSVKNTALVCLETAYDRFDTGDGGSIRLSDVLGLVNMNKTGVTYTVTTVSDTQSDLSAEQAAAAVIIREQGRYTLSLGENSWEMKTISIKQ